MGLMELLYLVMKTVGNPYLGVFVVSLLANLTLFFPVPYLAVVFTIGLKAVGHGPFILSILGAIGATLGKFVSYLIGYSGRVTLGEKYRRRFDALRRILGGSPFFAAFLFAASPLPDDIVFIPLGMMEYSPAKTFLACLFGKFLLTSVAVWSGKFSGSTISWIIGSEVENTWLIVISIGVLIVATVMMLKIDWEKLLLRGKGEEYERRK